MDFRIDARLPATAAQLWAIFFDVQRVAGLIPGCENVMEVDPLKEYSAVMKQRIGPFKLEVPTRIGVESHTLERNVVLRAAGRDKFTGTTLDVLLQVNLEEPAGDANQCNLALDAQMQVAGRLASLGYPVVRKRSEELFAEFEKRLRRELEQFDDRPTASPIAAAPQATVPARAPAPSVAGASGTRPAAPAAAVPVVAPGTATASAVAPSVPRTARPGFTLLWPRAGISLAVGVTVAHVATALGQSPWWWLAAPVLGLAAGLGRKEV